MNFVDAHCFSWYVFVKRFVVGKWQVMASQALAARPVARFNAHNAGGLANPSTTGFCSPRPRRIGSWKAGAKTTVAACTQWAKT